MSKIRIVVWNCRMGFRKKREALWALEPDLAIVPECSQEAAQACREDGFSQCWWGEKKHKGLAVLAAKPWTLEVGRTPSQKWIAPVRVNGPFSFLLLAVWACRVGESKELNYIGQVFEAIRRHSHWFNADLPVLLCGDLNSNANFDHARKIRNHTAVVRLLAQKNLLSAYHHFFSEEPGKETRPTHYFWHQRARGFHIDYVFLPRQWAPLISNVEVGTYQKWRSVSDHVPLIVDLSVRGKR